MLVTCTHWYLGTQETFTSLDAALKKYSLRREDLCKSPLQIEGDTISQRFSHPCYRIECVESMKHILDYLKNHLIPVAETKDCWGISFPLIWPIHYGSAATWRTKILNRENNS
jgi:hypothetical protein